MGKITFKNCKLFSSRDISDLYNIPYELLSKILQRLCKLGYLQSVKGPNGGYLLNSEQVSALEKLHWKDKKITTKLLAKDISTVVDGLKIKDFPKSDIKFLKCFGAVPPEIHKPPKHNSWRATSPNKEA